MAERAVAMAREAPEDANVGLAEPEQLASAWDLAALDLSDPAGEPGAALLEASARAVEAAALEAKGITKVEAVASYSQRALHMAATNGFSGGYGRTSISLWRWPSRVGHEMQRDYAGEGRVYAFRHAVGGEDRAACAERTLARVGSVKPKTGTYPVVYDERVAASLVGHLLSAINGTSIARGSSWGAGLVGQASAAAGVSLIEDPHRARIGSVPGPSTVRGWRPGGVRSWRMGC